MSCYPRAQLPVNRKTRSVPSHRTSRTTLRREVDPISHPSVTSRNDGRSRHVTRSPPPTAARRGHVLRDLVGGERRTDRRRRRPARARRGGPSRRLHLHVDQAGEDRRQDAAAGDVRAEAAEDTRLRLPEVGRGALQEARDDLLPGEIRRQDPGTRGIGYHRLVRRALHRPGWNLRQAGKPSLDPGGRDLPRPEGGGRPLRTPQPRSGAGPGRAEDYRGQRAGSAVLLLLIRRAGLQDGGLHAPDARPSDTGADLPGDRRPRRELYLGRLSPQRRPGRSRFRRRQSGVRILGHARLQASLTSAATALTATASIAPSRTVRRYSSSRRPCLVASVSVAAASASACTSACSSGTPTWRSLRAYARVPNATAISDDPSVAHTRAKDLPQEHPRQSHDRSMFDVSRFV